MLNVVSSEKEKLQIKGFHLIREVYKIQVDHKYVKEVCVITEIEMGIWTDYVNIYLHNGDKIGYNFKNNRHMVSFIKHIATCKEVDV